MSSPFLNVHALAELLDVNEKKIYQMAAEGLLPGTKITGKWLFPRHLIEQWVQENSHGGVLLDRLLIGGADDVLMHRLCAQLNRQYHPQQCLHYSPCGSQNGLVLLARQQIDACLIHWSPSRDQALLRHQALLRAYAPHRHWVLVRFAHRQQGVVSHPRLAHAAFVPEQHPAVRWGCRQAGSGSQRAFTEYCAERQLAAEQYQHTPFHSERELASAIHRGDIDLAPGSKAMALEHGLHFSWVSDEVLDWVVPKAVYFRTLFQSAIQRLRALDARACPEIRAYDTRHCGDCAAFVD